MKTIKLIAINLMICGTLFGLINFAFYFDSRSYSSSSTKPDKRANLPNYKDADHADRIFSDYQEQEFIYKSYVGWTRVPYVGKTTTVNKDGDRIHPQITDPLKPVVRFFGGSTTWGTGTDDRHTIPALFDDTTNNRFNVLNHGESAYSSRNELARLINVANQNKPLDFVIFYDGVNDIAKQCRQEVHINGHEKEQRINEALTLTEAPALLNKAFSTIFYAFTLEKIQRKKTKKSDRLRSFRCHDDTVYAEKVAETLVNNWKIARDIVLARDGKFLAILQPVAFLSDTKKSHLSLSKELRAQYEAVYPHIQRKIQNLDWALDMTMAFDHDDYIYIDFCHVNAPGNRIIAEQIGQLSLFQ